MTTVRAIFFRGVDRQEVGSVELRGKRAVLIGKAEELSFIKVFERGSGKELTVRDGERYIRALPDTFRPNQATFLVELVD